MFQNMGKVRQDSVLFTLLGETELDTPEVDTSSHFGNTRSRCIKQNPELGTPELGTPELDTSLQFQK